ASGTSSGRPAASRRARWRAASTPRPRRSATDRGGAAPAAPPRTGLRPACRRRRGRGSGAATAVARSTGPGSLADAARPRRPAGPRDPGRSRDQASSGGSTVQAGLLLAAGALPHLVDLVYEGQQLLRVLEVERGLHLRGLLGGLPEDVVQVRVLLEVLGLEIVVPQDVEVVLDQVGALLLDHDRPRPEEVVARGLV